MIGKEPRFDAVALQKVARHAGILAHYEVDAGQDAQGPERDVGEIADGRGDDIEAGQAGIFRRFTGGGGVIRLCSRRSTVAGSGRGTRY